jgi:hypothetical protein
MGEWCSEARHSVGVLEAFRSMIFGFVFSRDRALQLDGLIRSFKRHCQDAWLGNLTVLYHATSKEHRQGYDLLMREHPEVSFVRGQDFRTDVLSILGEAGLGKPLGSISKRLTTVVPKLGAAIGPWSKAKSDRYVLFLADDNIFVRSFSLGLIMRSLRTRPAAIGFSLGLGLNSTFCYRQNREQQVPVVIRLNEDLIQYEWARGDGDFGHPFEISSSAYRLSDALPVIARISFKSPDTLEAHFADQARHFAKKRPYLLAYSRSVTFSNAVNRVQNEYTNPPREATELAPDRLGALYLEGQRIDIAAYDRFVPSASQQEVEVVLTDGQTERTESETHS